MSTETPTSGGSESPPHPPEVQKSKRVEWSDLNKYQRALLMDFRKDGIYLTPEQVLKISSGQIHYRPRARPLVALHILGEDADGHIDTLAEARRVEIDAFNARKPPNPDFMRLWQNGTKEKSMSLSLNTRHGTLGLAGHGGQHFIKQRLQDHDIDSILAALLAYKYASQGRPLPKRFKFDKKLRKKLDGAFECLQVAIADRNQAQTGTQWGPR